MKRLMVLAPLILLMTGCTTGETPAQTQTVSITQYSNGTTRTATTSTTGVAGAFYVAPPEDLCAIAKAALLYERDRGATAPVEGLFYDHDIAIGPDCTGTYITAGLPFAAAGAGETRRVFMPRLDADGRVTVDIGYGCTKSCRGGAHYVFDRKGGEWRVDPDKTSPWTR
jgi:hypothetical protein